jgi:hypothetical protein
MNGVFYACRLLSLQLAGIVFLSFNSRGPVDASVETRSLRATSAAKFLCRLQAGEWHTRGTVRRAENFLEFGTWVVNTNSGIDVGAEFESTDSRHGHLHSNLILFYRHHSQFIFT